MSIAAFAIAQAALSETSAASATTKVPAQRVVMAVSDPKPAPEPR